MLNFHISNQSLNIHKKKVVRTTESQLEGGSGNCNTSLSIKTGETKINKDSLNNIIYRLELTDT